MFYKRIVFLLTFFGTIDKQMDVRQCEFAYDSVSYRFVDLIDNKIINRITH